MGKIAIHFRSLVQTDFYDHQGWGLSQNNNMIEVEQNEWNEYIHMKKQFELLQMKLVEKTRGTNWKNCEKCGNGFIPKNNKKNEHIATAISPSMIQIDEEVVFPVSVLGTDEETEE